jgi:hypothetical protein
MALKINYYFESLVCRKSLLTHFQNIEKIMKKSHFDSKPHSGHFEKLNHVLQEVFADLHEIEPVMMVHVNAFNTVGTGSLSKLSMLFTKQMLEG